MDKWKSLAGLAARKLLYNGSVKANGVLLGDMVRKLNTSHVMVSWAFALQNAVACFISPLTKVLLDIFPGRRICIVGGLIVSLSYIYCGLRVNSVVQLLCVYIMYGIGFGLLNYPTFINMEAHFRDQFSTLSAVVSLFDFIGVAVMPPVLQALKDEYGLEQGLVVYGAIMLHLVVVGVCYREPSNTEASMSLRTPSDQNEIGKTFTENPPEGKKSEENTNGTFCSILRHRKLILVLVIDFIIGYVYISWALFLVSLGTSVGLEGSDAVVLSTAGGAGGLAGNVIVIFLFYFGYMNPCTGWVIPITINGISFIGCALARDFRLLAGLSFTNGLALGTTCGASYGLVPSMVCRDHLPHAVILNYIVSGTAVQFGGIFSGFLHDMTGSTQYVFAFNGLLCFLVLPPVAVWAISDKSIEDCGSESK